MVKICSDKCPRVVVVPCGTLKNSGIEGKLGPCRCGEHRPAGRLKDQGVCVRVYTDDHHHVVRDSGCILWFRFFGLLVGYMLVSAQMHVLYLEAAFLD